MDHGMLLQIGGIYHLAFVVFHLFFWKLFRWKADLRSLTPINQAVMPILNLCLTFVFLGFAYLSLFYTEELLAEGLGRAVLGVICVFWVLRAIQQVVFFGLRKPRSAFLFVVFLGGVALYLVPLTG